jgi:tetratricopeptide (TPR) repeat protein
VTTRVLRSLVALLVLLGATRVAAAEAPVTFTKDVAPIVYAKCGVCHRPGGAAPFSLLTYPLARAHATQIATVTRNGYMPPWLADGDYGGAFLDQPRLTPADLEVLQRWAAEGAVEGDPKDLPPMPVWTEGWQLGKPDLVMSTPAYTLPPEGTDVFRIFVIRIPNDVPKFVRGLEFRPGNPRVVHHANIRIDRAGQSRRFDDDEPGPGYSGLIAHSAVYPDGHFLGWTPGQVPPLLPRGLAWRLEPGTDLVVELHMQPSGKPEPVEATIGFYFGNDPPERTPAMLRLGRQSIDIPPGEKRYTITDSFVLPVDVDVHAVQPHAHFRAKEITGFATLPDGSVRPLIHIRDWDFRWQHVYRYVEPFALPRGTRLEMRFTYDNSAENPRNPNNPPRRVFWGQRSSDEMGDLWIQVLPRSRRDLDLLNGQLMKKVMAEDVIGYERWLESEPDSVPLHNSVAQLYLDLNRPADAVRHFRAALDRSPGLAAAHFNLGTALTIAGDLAAATTEYGRALELRPDYPQAHNNLGSILLQQGQPEAALSHLQQALAADPSNAQAHYNASTATRRLGRSAEAVAHLKRTVQLAPDSPVPMIDLAWLLAASADTAVHDVPLALRVAERAVTLTERRDAGALDAQAAAQAAAGDFDGAVATATAALALNPANAGEIRARLALYEKKQMFRLAR